MDSEDQNTPLLGPSPEALASVKVFPLIPAIRKDVFATIDSALSWEQLTASDVNFSVVRPIVFKYARLRNLAVVYACLVVRSYYLKESEADLAYAGVNLARANLCELLATKLLHHFASNYIKLVAVITSTWNPLAGAPSAIVDEVVQLVGGDDSDINNPQSALEMAIATEAKHFVASPVTQRVVNDIYSGKVIFSNAATRSILADNYKPRGIQIYDWTEHPFLDHYRLRVPRYGAILEFLNFALLLVTFVLCLSNKDPLSMNFWELLFILFAAAFALEEYTAATEHGWIIYIANMWNVFDTSFVAIFFLYLGFRLSGLVYEDPHFTEMAFDILAIDACILFPRLAFFAVSNHVVILSLRAMISEFVFFIGIAATCFSGLLFTLWTLSKDGDIWSIKSISWLMVQIWFGNTYLSFAQAKSFHPLFGPILMTCFAALSNTLLVTILISILSNTVARIDANATQEYLFQFTITTIEGVKADALFSYQPPFNILAFLVLKPASWVLSPRALHSVNVLLIKFTNFPVLIIIAIYERHLSAGRKIRETGKGAAQSIFNTLPRHIKHTPLIEALMGSASADLYDAIFDVEAEHDSDLFGPTADDDELPMLRSFHSRERLPGGGGRLSPTPSSHRQRPASISITTTTPHGSPRPRISTNLEPETTPASPLARLFNRESLTVAPAQLNASVRRIEAVVENIKDPVHGLREEIKELQERQSRIESLLLTLTRGMRSAP
ncbi:hypothetical protein PM082_012953 [Marasmius tenuissimus]|nr:hypothetical protein PM082_012953 [Marasmius tenuissimus]